MRIVPETVASPHEFTHSGKAIYCRWCGYVCYVEESTYERNMKRQRDIPAKCMERTVTVEVSP